MFEITIKGETLSELASNAQAIAKQFETTPAADVRKPARKAKASDPQPEAEDEVIDIGGEGDSPEDALDAPAEPMPEGADAIVDAGTGQPVPKTKPKPKAKDDAPIQMTMDDVKVAAAKLAAKDTPALAGILKKYDAPNLSGVPKEKLGDFAADVMEALG